MRLNSTAEEVIFYFIRNPEEEMTSLDIEAKFGVDYKSVNWRLSRAVRDGYLEVKSEGPGRGKLAIYSAGLVLLEKNGHIRILEERRAANDRRTDARGPDRRQAAGNSPVVMVMACCSVGA